MKVLFDCFPVLLFFVAYKLYDFYVATALAIVASLLQVVYSWLRYKKIDKMSLITAAAIVILGTTTLILKNEIFLKWKPTVVYAGLGTAFLISQFSKKTLVEYLLSQIVLPQHIWRRLNISWVCFFFVMGATNLYVAYNYSTDTWVHFKLIGILGLTFFFVIIQAVFLARYAEHLDEKKNIPPRIKSEKTTEEVSHDEHKA